MPCLVVRRSVAALASIAALAVLPASAHAGGVVTEFSTGLTVANAPADIAAGPDGNLWFTEQGPVPGVGRITPAGSITEFPAPVPAVPGDIVAGDDGGVWFTESGPSEAIARIDPASGTIVEHALPSGAGAAGLDVGPDGDLWFAEAGRSKLGRMTTAGEVSEYDLGLSGDDTLKDVATGPDGWIWFTVEGAGATRTRTGSAHAIGRLNPADGDVCLFSEGLTGAPNKIVAASDGKLYFTESGDPAAIGRVKTDGTITEYRSGLTADSRPAGIAEGGDRALWFTAGASPGRIGRLSPQRTFTEFLAGTTGLDLTPDSGPTGITRGPDGNIWFTETALDGRIGRMTVPPGVALAVVNAKQRKIEDGVLEASVAANSQATTFHVEYGPDGAFGARTAEVAVPASAGAEPVTQSVALALKPSSHYHARLVAANGSGEAVSPTLELWTDAAGTLLDFEPPLPAADPPAPTTAGAAPGSWVEHREDDHAHAAAPPVAPPVLGEAVVVQPLTGAVRVRPPGARRYRPLEAGANLPVGTLVDTREGKIVLKSARDRNGRTQRGTFWGSVFQIRQKHDGKGMTDLVLRGGSFARCGTRAGISVLARDATGRRRVVRRLWGKDRHSRFRTHGRDSVATVRGTRWVTTDRCDGTRTRVTQGAVLVRDLRAKRKVLVRAGHAYLARHRGRR